MAEERVKPLAVGDSALRESEEKFRALAEGSRDTIMRFDPAHRHLYVNPIVEQQTGVPAGAFIGRTHEELGFPEHLTKLWAAAIDTVFATGQVHRIEFELPNGTWIDWQLVPEFSAAGEVAYVMTSGREITERKRAEAALAVAKHDLERRVAERTRDLAQANELLAREVEERRRAEVALRTSEERLRSLLSNLPVGVYRSTPDGRIVEANEIAIRMLGFANLEDLRQVDIDDLYVERRDRRGHMSRLRRDPTQPAEFQLRAHDGHTLWVQDHPRAVHDERGRVAYYDGVLVDVSQRRAIEDALRESEVRYRTLARNFPEGAVALFDGELRLAVGEGAALEAAGLGGGRLEGRLLAEVLSPELFTAVEPTFCAALAGESRTIEVAAWGRVYLLHALPLRDDQGGVSGGMAVVHEITERKLSEERLRYLSTHDPLTGLFNRAQFEEELVRISRSGPHPVSVVVADVDGLKRVNDRFGHAAGDELLRQAADLLRRSFRPDDVIARIGGDEFAILLPGAGAEVGEDVLQRIRASEGDMPNAEAGFRLRFSLGLATADEHASLNEVLSVADSRMYKDKLLRFGGGRTAQS